MLVSTRRSRYRVAAGWTMVGGLGGTDAELKAWPGLVINWMDHHGWTK